MAAANASGGGANEETCLFVGTHNLTNNKINIRQKRNGHLNVTTWEQNKTRLQMWVAYFWASGDEPLPYEEKDGDKAARPKCLPLDCGMITRALEFLTPYAKRYMDGEEVTVLNAETVKALKAMKNTKASSGEKDIGTEKHDR